MAVNELKIDCSSPNCRFVICYDDEDDHLYHLRTEFLERSGPKVRPTKDEMREILVNLARLYAHMEDDA